MRKHTYARRWWSGKWRRGGWAALLGVCLLFLPACSGERVKPQNLIVICIDTVRYDVFWLPERAGYKDRLSSWTSRALAFDRTQSTAPWTVPAIASLLTGLYPNQHGAGRFTAEVANLAEEIPSPILPDVPTLTEHLQARGYQTHAFVSHPWFRANYGMDRGFTSLKLQKRAEKLTTSAVDWLQAHKSDAGASSAANVAPAPFFLYLHFMEAHEAHRQALDEVRAFAEDLPEGLKAATLTLAPGDTCIDVESATCLRFQAYVVAVLELRNRVADVLEWLSANDLYGTTLTVLFSDHGEEFRDHFHEEKARATDPRQIYGVGHGHSLYQELLHVPFLIWHPELAGRHVEAPSSLVDLLPSLIDWLEIPNEGPELSGLSLAQVLDKPGNGRPIFSSGIAYGPEQAAVYSVPWKLINVTEPQQNIYFRLDVDPKERAPATSPESAPALKRALSTYVGFEAAEHAAGQEQQIDDEVLERLQSLGYLDSVGESQ